MGFWSKMFGGKSKAPSAEVSVSSASGANGMRSSRNAGALLRMYGASSKLRPAIAKIADAVAAAQWSAGYETDGLDGKAVYSKAARSAKITEKASAIKLLTADGRFEEAPNHPLVRLLDKPCSKISGFDLMKLTSTYIDLLGEAFWLKIYGSMAHPTELLPIPPTWVTSVPGGDDGVYKVRMGNTMHDIECNKMVWFRDIDPESPYTRGSGLGMALADELDADEYAAQLIKATFYNKAEPSGIVSAKNVTADQLDRFRDEWENSHRGHRRHGLLKFTNADVSFEQIEKSFEELQLLDLRKSVRDEILHAYGIPPEILGIVDNSNKATITAASLIMSMNVVVPRLERIMRTIQTQLVPDFDARLVVYFENPVPPDLDSQFEAAKAAPWALTVNEWRTKWQGLDDIGPSGDIRMVPLGLLAERIGGSEPAPIMDASVKPQKLITIAQADDVAQVVADALEPDLLVRELDPIWKSHMVATGAAVFEELGASGLVFDLQNPLVKTHLRQFAGERINDLVNENTKDALRTSLIEGVRAGEGIAELRGRVHDVFLEGNMDIYKVRAERIARTEVHRSANASTYYAQAMSGLVEEREWIASFINTRPEHAGLHGSTAKIGEPFIADGYSALFPGEFGAPEMDINCMCTTIAIIKDKSYDQAYLKAYWEKFVNDQEVWVKEARKALIKGFESQNRAALEALMTFE